MLERTLQHVGHGLEPAVRMVGCADRLAGPEVGGAHLVEEEEGIDLGAGLVGGAVPLVGRKTARTSTAPDAA